MTPNPRASRRFGTSAVAVAALLLGGCCATRHCQPGEGPMASRYQVPTNAARGILDVTSSTNRIDMLVLSGGGSHGAWGAGVLRGWRDNEKNRRPRRFQVVTGVSTGALLSTFAFLGEPEDDDLLAGVYTNVVTSDIYRQRFLPLVLFSDSLSSSAPLKHLISQHITSNTLARVAAAGRDGKRGLYVGTVNLDSGKLVIWDLVKIASDESNPKRLDLYRNVVLASASIPVMVPPVKIEGHLYVDGGAREQLFFAREFFPQFRRSESETNEPKKEHPKLYMHVIVNGQLGVATNCVGDCLTGVTLRTLELLLDANVFGDLYHLKYLLNLNHFGHFGLAAIPSDFPVTSSAVFDREMMGKLYWKGVEFGSNTEKWPNRIPEFDDP